MLSQLLIIILPLYSLSLRFASEGSSEQTTRALPQAALIDSSSIESLDLHLAGLREDDLLHGFNVGTKPGGSDVVVDGVPQWTRQHSGQLEFTDSEVTLYATISSKDNDAQKFLAPNVHTIAIMWGLPDDQGAPFRSDLSSSYADIGAGSIAEVNVTSDLGEGQPGLAFGSPKVVRLFLRCVRPGVALLEVVLTLAHSSLKPISVWLEKSCGGGFHKGLNVGTAKGDADLVKDGSVTQDKLPDVGALVDESHFYARYVPEGAHDPDRQLLPQVNCIAESGDGSLGTRLNALKNPDAPEDHRYDVSYFCMTRGTFSCSMRLGLKFWRSPEMSWHKQCGGEARPDIVVESSLPSYPAVFAKGKPISSWALENPVVRLFAEEEDVTFFVRRDSDARGTSVAVLQTPEVVSSDPSVLDVSIDGASAIVGRVLASRGDAAALLTHHHCKGHGDVEVTVFVPMEDTSALQQTSSSLYGPVSFAYHKHCGMHPGVPILALSMFAVMCSLSASIAACICWKYGHSNEHGYGPM